jgi:hypothetical protein
MGEIDGSHDAKDQRQPDRERHIKGAEENNIRNNLHIAKLRAYCLTRPGWC